MSDKYKKLLISVLKSVVNTIDEYDDKSKKARDAQSEPEPAPEYLPSSGPDSYDLEDGQKASDDLDLDIDCNCGKNFLSFSIGQQWADPVLLIDERFQDSEKICDFNVGFNFCPPQYCYTIPEEYTPGYKTCTPGYKECTPAYKVCEKSFGVKICTPYPKVCTTYPETCIDTPELYTPAYTVCDPPLPCLIEQVKLNVTVDYDLNKFQLYNYNSTTIVDTDSPGSISTTEAIYIFFEKLDLNFTVNVSCVDTEIFWVNNGNIIDETKTFNVNFKNLTLMCEAIQKASNDGNISLEFDCGGCLELTNKNILNVDEDGFRLTIGKLYLGLCISYEAEGVTYVTASLQFYSDFEYNLNSHLDDSYFPNGSITKFTQTTTIPIPIA